MLEVGKPSPTTSEFVRSLHLWDPEKREKRMSDMEVVILTCGFFFSHTGDNALISWKDYESLAEGIDVFTRDDERKNTLRRVMQYVDGDFLKIKELCKELNRSGRVSGRVDPFGIDSGKMKFFSLRSKKGNVGSKTV